MAAATKTESKGGNIYSQETYIITLPLDEKHTDDVQVGVNGLPTRIQRGEEVEVSSAVYEVLKNSEKMDRLALQRRMKLKDKNN